MSPLAISLVLLSALFHALWNYAAKRSIGGPVFIWLFGVVEMFLYLPFVLYLMFNQQPFLSFVGLFFIVGSSVLHIAYFVLLSKGYQVGDLSIVYPLARATGPLIATFTAILLFGERPTILAIIGAFLICGGAFWLTGDPRKLRQHEMLPSMQFALLTGVAIAGYTLWDAYSVTGLMIAPLIFQWGIGAIRVLILTPYTLRHWGLAKTIWQRDKWKVVFVGIFSALAYVLILIALRVSPVSYVAPMRVISTLIGVGMGVGFLSEGDVKRRLSAASVMVFGVIALSLG